ncbi:MAG: hypothetical protein IPM03_19825 [Sulfuritalea sp.]|nr:hypothetical protein [Sulfuritalea sp.]
MVGGDARCWCADPPSADALPVPAPGSPASCFCPACLAAVKAERAGTTLPA